MGRQMDEIPSVEAWFPPKVTSEKPFAKWKNGTCGKYQVLIEIKRYFLCEILLKTLNKLDFILGWKPLIPKKCSNASPLYPKMSDSTHVYKRNQKNGIPNFKWIWLPSINSDDDDVTRLNNFGIKTELKYEGWPKDSNGFSDFDKIFDFMGLSLKPHNIFLKNVPEQYPKMSAPKELK